MPQVKKNIVLNILFLFYYFFGVIFYDVMPGGLQLIDEVFPWLLFALLLYEKRGRLPSIFLYLFCIFLFYLVYSILIKSNVISAIVFDCIVQIKPFLTFCSFYYLTPRFSKQQKSIIRISMLCGAMILLVVGTGRIGEEMETVNGEILTGARYAFAALYTGLTYFSFSRKRVRDMAVSLLIMSLGFCVPTSKFLGGIILFLILFFLMSRPFRKIRILLAVCVAVLCIPLLLSIADDFMLYFSSEDIARAALVITGLRIFIDFVPFGSGFASFATTASANSYSKLYEQYDLSNIYGLSEADVDSGLSFISDVYLSSLAQFGFAGIVLLVLFVIYIIRTAKKNCSGTGKMFIVIFIILNLVIESVADSTFIGNRGIFVMLLLASIIVDEKSEISREQTLTLND